MLSTIRSLLPKDTADIFAFLFLNISFWAIALYEIIHVLPTVDENSRFGYYFHLFVGCGFFVNIYGAYYKLITVESSTRGIILPTILKEGWQ